jgi:hypothetical protein
MTRRIVIRTEQTHRATIDDSQAPIKVLSARVAKHAMPERQLKTPIRSYGEETGDACKSDANRTEKARRWDADKIYPNRTDTARGLDAFKRDANVADTARRHDASNSDTKRTDSSRDRRRQPGTHKGAKCESRPSCHARATAQNSRKELRRGDGGRVQE